MEREEQHNNRIWTWVLGIIAVILVLLAGVRLALKSNWVLDKVRDMVVEQAGNQINGSLSIESIRGDLFRGFTVTGIKLLDTSGEEVMTADTLQVVYQIGSVIKSPHTINEIQLTGMEVFAVQDSDSVWNVQTLLQAVEDTTEEESETYWHVHNFSLQNTNIDIRSELLLPDGLVRIDNLNAEATAGAGEPGMYGTLRTLDFTLNEQRLPEPVNVWLSGTGDEQRVSLETFVIQTGRSFFEATGDYQTGEDLKARAEFTPLSRNDLSAYIADLPLRQDMRMELGFSGRLQNLTISLTAQADGLEQLTVEAGLDLEDSPALTSLNIVSLQTDGPLLTGMEDSPRFSSFSFSGEGRISAENPEQARWDGSLDINGLSYGEYRLDALSAGFSMLNEQVNFDGMLVLDGQRINLAASAENVAGEEPGWNAGLSSSPFNPALWLNEPELEGNLNIQADASGRGFDPERFFAAVDLVVDGDRFGDQAFSEMRFHGDVTPRSLDGTLSGRIDRSSFSVDFLAEQWQTDIPQYQFTANLREFNIEELTEDQNFPTYLNGTVTGSGRGKDPETLALTATAYLDSTLINHEQIDTLRADFSIQNQFLSVENAILNSPITDARFSFRQHLSEYTNPANRLDFTAELKDLMPLAPLFGLNQLESRGRVEGNIGRENDRLQFHSHLDLEEITVDTLFSSARVVGNVQGYIQEEPEVNLDLELENPMVSGFSVQDVNVHSFAVFSETETSGNIGFTLSDEVNSFHHRGDFRMDSTSAELLTNAIEITTSLRTLRLAEPFMSTYSQDVLRVDTLEIHSINEDSYLKLWASHIDSLQQRIGLDAYNLNMGAIQRPLIGEPLLEGVLSGSVHFFNHPDSLQIAASGLLNDIRYQSGEMDSLRIQADLAEEWLDLEMNGWHEQRRLISGAVRVPFLPGDPLTFDDQFFDREISGRFSLSRSDLNYWLSFLPENDIEETEGRIAAELTLGGVAGNPGLEGNFIVTNGVFSGIPVDSVGMDVLYRHEEKNVQLDGRIIARSRPVLDFDGMLPFTVDLKRAELILPDEDDSIHVSLRTNDFDLALFRNYVDRDVIRDLSGKLDGEVTFTGPMAGLHSEGRMILSNGGMRVVPAGINIGSIGARIDFMPDRIELTQFSMRSGPGRIRASGRIDLDGFTPGEIQMRLLGSQFRVANTQDYNAIVDLDASLTGTMQNPDLNGSLTFLNGFFFLQNFGERAVEDVRLDDEDEPESFAFYDSLAMEMDINFNRQFFIRNRQYLDMEIELAGQIDLVKERNRDLEIFGSLEGVEGFARPLGKNFELQEAVVSFFGPVDEPELNIRTLFEPPQRETEVRIFYIIEGTAQEPSFRFESEPELELQDIISYTLFGRPFYELESWQQTVAGNGAGGPTAADLAIDVLLDRVEMLASQQLGIDVVQIDNSGSGSNSTTSIKTGWYLNRRTFFAILNEISSTRPRTLFILEYLLQDNLELILTQGDDSREGIDLRWHHDY